MAAATARPASTIDLRSQASYVVRLGQSVLKPSEAKKFTSVQYNHKHTLRAPREARFSLQSSSASEEVLDVQDGDEEYKYAGRATTGRDLYVLVSKGTGKEAELVLERLKACHKFNLVQTPSESDAGRLAAQFPQLTFDDAEDLFGDDEDRPDSADASNPWDYRNYLKQSATTAKLQQSRERKPLASSEASQSRAASSTPLARPTRPSSGPLITQKKRKAQGPAKVDAKRVKAGTEPPQASASGVKAAQAVPRVRIDRKASVRRPSLDDSGELILENETPVTEKPPRRTGAMALALAGQLTQGPISLRSAASSPASMVASPMPTRPEGMEDGEEFEFGGSDSSPETVSKRLPKQQREDDYFGGGEDEDEGSNADADADVDDLELPSPAQTHQKNVSNATVTAADDEDDLDKQLALAMAEDDDGGQPPVLAESDEESEEE
ncbi:hypothetical protein LTR09_002353 [Extremus antarcticus]|uniref:Transcription elongation factor Eaf N-terminal domain-containing protein n=1 Tax=Extremus antarcticus TaxID=702011 RepID=A0AAJ0LV72_9PEZI|nr:hypothetical protein LTR09_002353 [Extremus antarcticus]